ncbi:LysR substrate-binding domain-containing protein [Rhodococcus rhodochrous]|uniref:LysR substrate-binding domain-containing protein n=1 Tax=Rhodococcus rhodochrous TaxID=1829 RepID=UPI001E37B173|nr:LysR substrate-binding domain-containing protein [Rhodococcus rhodochrous]
MPRDRTAGPGARRSARRQGSGRPARARGRSLHRRPTRLPHPERTRICLRRSRIEPYIAFEISEFETIRALVVQGLGVALLPHSETPVPGIATVPVAGIANRTIGLTTGTRTPSPAVARLHAHIAGHAARFDDRRLDS